MAKIKGVTKIKIKDLKPYEKNAKLHSEKQIKQIARSIKEFGWCAPCLVDEELNIIAGHGRVEAAKYAGIKEAPCVFIEGLTEAQYKAFVLADNRLAELGEWDREVLQEELEALKGLEFDVTITGFEIEEEPADLETPEEDEGESNTATITFVLTNEQKEVVENVLESVKNRKTETYGNTNKKGNQLFEVIREWDARKTS